MIKIAVGSFDSAADAANVARDLRAAGFLDGDVNMIINNAQRDPASASHDAAMKNDPPAVAEGAAEGAFAGGALGGMAGLAASVMGLAIPGIGPILAAGPIVAALAGAGTGAIAGGLIGSLADLGIQKSEAEYYAEAVRRGAALITVRVDATRADEALAIMRSHDAFDIKERVEQWRRSGWDRYDPDARPFTYDQIERDRSQSRTPRGELRR